MSSQHSPATEEEIHLQDYIRVLLRRRYAVLVVFLVVFFLVALYTLLAKPVYEASATLHVNDAKSKTNLFSELGIDRQSPIETEIEILKSRTNLEEMVRRLYLDWEISKVGKGFDFRILEFSSTPPGVSYVVTLLDDGRYKVTAADEKLHFTAQGRGGERLNSGGLILLIDEIKGRRGESFHLRQLPLADVMAGLRKKVKAIEVGKRTDIIQLSFQGHDPALASEVVNTLAEVYLERGIALKSEESRKTVEFITSQVATVRDELNAAEEKLQRFKSLSGMIRLDEEAEALIKRLTETEKLRSEAMLRRQQAEFAIEGLQQALRSGKRYAPVALLDDPVLQQLATEQAKLEVERQGLLTELTAEHPKVRVVSDQIAEIRKKLLTSYRALQEGHSAQIADLEGVMAGYEARLRELPSGEQELARLTRLAKVNADIYVFLLQKQQEARIAQAATISSINVIDPAVVPDRPIKPNKAKNLLLGAIVGLMLGVGLAFFIEYLDDTIKDGETAQRLLGWPLLAVIPHIEFAGANDRELVSANAPRSAAAEAFRALRTALHFAGTEQGRKVILITSTLPGEGKSTVSANLAETIAQTNKRVLLIGCDLRKPTIHHAFNLSNRTGLTNFLIGDTSAEKIVLPSGIDNLTVITSGIVPPNPAELLGSDRMRWLVGQVREKFDIVILDAPPMLSVTDAAVLAPFSDAAVVVIAAGRVSTKLVPVLRDTVTQCQVKVAGLVINDRDARGSDYYGGYYGSYYGDDELNEEPLPLWRRFLGR